MLTYNNKRRQELFDRIMPLVGRDRPITGTVRLMGSCVIILISTYLIIFELYLYKMTGQNRLIGGNPNAFNKK